MAAQRLGRKVLLPRHKDEAQAQAQASSKGLVYSSSASNTCAQCDARSKRDTSCERNTRSECDAHPECNLGPKSDACPQLDSCQHKRNPLDASAATPYVPPPRIEDFDEKNDIADIEFYQPVTVLVLTDEPEIRNSLPRAIRPPAVVEKYMDSVFDTCKRADETYLAFRLPKEGALTDADAVRSGDATPAVATPTADAVMSAALDKERERKRSTQRSRKSIAQM